MSQLVLNSVVFISQICRVPSDYDKIGGGGGGGAADKITNKSRHQTRGFATNLRVFCFQKFYSPFTQFATHARAL